MSLDCVKLLTCYMLLMQVVLQAVMEELQAVMEVLQAVMEVMEVAVM